MEALVWLKLGDLRAARRCVARLKDATADATSSHDELATGGESGEEDDISFRTLSALLHIAAGDFPAAVSEWRALHEQFPSDATIQQNLAVCLIYTGHMSEAKELLEALVDADATPAFQALLFNLCTVYELCTGRANEAKAHLVERVAAKSPSESGWEKASIEFKL
jgi:predicted Zn-dependent protease